MRVPEFTLYKCKVGVAPKIRSPAFPPQWLVNMCV